MLPPDFGEADHFPGLTVDRFNDILVAQTLSLGVEVRKELILTCCTRFYVSRVRKSGACMNATM